jgi:hypothetical protein
LIAATVNPEGAEAGEAVQASRALFPAAMTTEILSSIAESTALFKTDEKVLPILILATAGVLSS